MVFETNITGTNKPVIAGENFDVSYSVENTGSSQDTQDIELVVREAADVTGVIDNFESGSLSSRWDLYVTDAAIDETYAYNGSQSLLTHGSGTGSYIGASESDGGVYIPERGDRWSVYIRTPATGGGTDDVRPQCRFFQHDTDNRYLARWNVDDELLELRTESNGTWSGLSSATVDASYPGSEWWRLEVETYVDSDHIVARLYDTDGAIVAETDAYDDEHHGDQFQLAEWGADADVWMDYATYTSGLLEPATVILDDFESDDPLAAYSGDTGGFDVVSKPIFHGNQAIETGTDFQHIHNTGASAPAKGDVFDVWLWSSVGSEEPNSQVARVHFGYEDASNSYLCNVHFDSSTVVEMREVTDGTSNYLDDFPLPDLDTQTWYRLHIEWDDGTMGGSEDELRYSLHTRDGERLGGSAVSDSSHASGSGYGFEANVYEGGNETIAFDRATTESEGYDTIDTFVDKNLIEYSGDTGSFTTSVDDNGLFGDDVLSATDTSGGTWRAIYSQPHHGLDGYPRRGDSFAVYARPGDVTATECRFDFYWATDGYPGDSGASNYQCHVGFDTAELQVAVDGSVASTADFLTGATSDDWYELRVDWDDPTITATLIRLTDGAVVARTTMDDTSHDSGGIAWASELDGSGMVYDSALLHTTYPVTVIEDFEDGLSGFGGDTSLHQTQSSVVIEGESTLECTSDFGSLGDDGGDHPTPRGYEYRCAMRMDNTDESAMWFGIQCQDEANEINNGYVMSLNVGSNNAALMERDGGSTVRSTSDASTAMSRQETYIAVIQLDETGVTDNVVGWVEDATGAQISNTLSFSDDTHTGGGVFFYTDRSETYYDYITQEPL